MRNLQSSNPALREDVIRGGDWWSDTAAGEAATISGIVNKTGLFAFVLAVAGAGGYALIERNPGLLFPLLILNLVVTLGCFFMIRGFHGSIVPELRPPIPNSSTKMALAMARPPSTKCAASDLIVSA